NFPALQLQILFYQSNLNLIYGEIHLTFIRPVPYAFFLFPFLTFVPQTMSRITCGHGFLIVFIK
ncbi:MAG: hypothetical protein OSA95_06145, partial [Opitutales bacterium]|nr:hypothetical protein [Opitutales bacterium]